MELRTGLLALAGVMAAPGVVDACGGCFHPEVPAVGTMRAQVVTDHRMVLSLSETQTTLWDQIRYAGSPDEFVWVLPVPDGAHADVQLADNAFIDAMDQYTAPVITGRLPACFGASSGYGGGGSAGGCGGFGYNASSSPTGEGAGGNAMGSESTATAHMREEVVGPYAVNIIGPHLGGDNLAAWLTAHHYAITPDVMPVLDHYASLHTDYVILRLRPGEGVQAMQPVRVTLPGYVPDLPLQMITAGVANKVALTLMVLANGQIEAQGFANTTLDSADLTFDYVSQVSNYPAAFSRLVDAYTNGVWVTESVQSIAPSISYQPTPVTPPSVGPLDGGDVSDAAVTDDAFSDGALSDGALDDGSTPADANAAQPAHTDPYADLHAAFAGFNNAFGRATVTRMRTELRPVQLIRDLRLSAASTDGFHGTQYVAQTLLNGPPCPATPAAPRSGADGCSVTHGQPGRYSGPALLVGALATLAGRRVRRRTRGTRGSREA